jgi:hypothetical protein
MILSVIVLGILACLIAGIAALAARYSILMALWLYTLFGYLVVTSGLLLTWALQILTQLRGRQDRQHAYSTSQQ